MTDRPSSVYWSEHQLIASRRVTFLDAPMHLLTMAETTDVAVEAMTKKVPLHHTVVNVAKLVSMQENAELRADVSEADLISIDGVGVVWGAQLLGVRVKERVAGVDLMERLFEISARAGFKPYLLGAEAHVLASVQRRLKRDLPTLQVAGFHDGYFKPEDELAIVEEINTSGADCLFVAMPTPRKERFLRRHRDVLMPSFVMGVGGSFDVYGGKVTRAPKIVQKLGLEWLFRILQEPRRLWRRYYYTNTRYFGILWRAYWVPRAD
tara:strand:+ start:3513 stop:4307 length:795 start_codon:yes stop_codon:yes gene_type:complete